MPKNIWDNDCDTCLHFNCSTCEGATTLPPPKEEPDVPKRACPADRRDISIDCDDCSIGHDCEDRRTSVPLGKAINTPKCFPDVSALTDAATRLDGMAAACRRAAEAHKKAANAVRASNTAATDYASGGTFYSFLHSGAVRVTAVKAVWTAENEWALAVSMSEELTAPPKEG